MKRTKSICASKPVEWFVLFHFLFERIEGERIQFTYCFQGENVPDHNNRANLIYKCLLDLVMMVCPAFCV